MAEAMPHDSGCFHCGEALPVRAVRLSVDGAERDFCCAGCGPAFDADPARYAAAMA